MSNRILKPGASAALGNYISMRLIRQNPMGWTAAMFTMYLGLDLPSTARLVRTQGVTALFRPHSSALTPIWMISFAVPAMLLHHYWRQVRSNLAPVVPGLMEAEIQACIIVLAVMLIVLACPLAWLGAPIAGSLALAGLAMVLGGAVGSAAPTGQSTLLRRLRGVLLLPLMLGGLLPHMLQRIVFSPSPVALVIAAGSALAMGLSLRLSPGTAAMETDQHELRQDQLAVRLASATPLAVMVQLRAVALWKPGGPSRDPVPPMLSLAMGPVGLLLQTLVQFLALLTIFVLLSLVTGDSLRKALQDQAPFALAVGAASTLAARMQWLSQRGEWPLLMVAGWFGSRRQFADAVFRMHRNSMLQLAFLNGLVASALALAMGLIGGRQALPVLLVVGGLVFGGSYTPSVPLLWKEFGGRGLMVAGGMAGYMGVMFTLSLAVFAHGLKPIAMVVAGLAAVFGIIMAMLAPRQLAAMDWPLEG